MDKDCTRLITQIIGVRIICITRYHKSPTSPQSPSYHYYREEFNYKTWEWERVRIATPEEIRGGLKP